MTHPLLEGTRNLARRFREARRASPSLSAEQFLAAQREDEHDRGGIARAQWIELLDVLRNAPEGELDLLVAQWLERQVSARQPGRPGETGEIGETESAATLPLQADAAATLKTPEAPPPPAEDAQHIDRRYRIVRVLGEGAFGKVFLVRDRLQNDQELALKLIKKEHTATSEALVRFKNEILLLRVLNHPGIPQIFNDGISEDGEFYYTMAYVAGRTLDDVIRKEAPLDPLRIVRITKQVLDVLDYAHARGAIHRDLKPGNIFLLHAGTPKEAVRVLDFGIAKVLSREGILEHAQTMNTEMPLGTPHYMSPEQVRGTEVDGRTDIYALGVIIYQMCSGRFPFSGKTLMEVLAARLERPPNPLEDTTTPAWLRELVMKLLERERERRPDTQSIRAALEQLHGSHRELSRKLTWIAAAGVAIAGVLAWAVFGRGPAEVGQAGGDQHASVPPRPESGDRGQVPNERGDPTPPANDGAQPETEAGGPERPGEAPANEPDAKQTSAATVDTDADGTPDLRDECPIDPLKIAPGQCGCGTPDTDSDGDGTADCNDKCPNNAQKTVPGLCGCDKPDIDTDGDGHLDCDDWFPNDPARWQAEANQPATAPAPAELPAARLPQGFAAASDAALDAQGVPSTLVHGKTGIVLDRVDANGLLFLGRTEVTREEWGKGPEALAAKTKLPPAPAGEKPERHPVVAVDLDAAKDFCDRNGLRLPTTDEWDAAARLAGGRAFPWGDEFVAGSCNSSDAGDAFRETAPVGSFASDRCGPFLDLAGNVQEWCVEPNGKPALRGGGWRSSAGACKLAAKSTAPSRGSVAIGFRVALTLEP